MSMNGAVVESGKTNKAGSTTPLKFMKRKPSAGGMAAGAARAQPHVRRLLSYLSIPTSGACAPRDIPTSFTNM